MTLGNRNFLDAGPDERYDFVVLSGAPNLLAGVDGDAWKAMCLALIRKMHLPGEIAFNFLTSYRTYSDPLLYYFDPGKCSPPHPSVPLLVLDASYPLYECTVTVFNKTIWPLNMRSEKVLSS